MTQGSHPSRGPLLDFNHGSALGLARVGPGQVTFDYSFEQGDDFTISVWARPTAIDEHLRNLVGGEESEKLPGLYLDKGCLHFKCWNPAGGKTHKTFTSPQEINRWVHVTWVKRGPRYEIYVDGKRRVTGPFFPKVNTSATSFRIGHGDGYWIGQITEVRIFHIAREVEDMERDWNRRLDPDEPGISAYWPCDEGSGAEIHDRGPSGHHGAMSGMVRWIEGELPFAREHRPTIDPPAPPAPAPAPEPAGTPAPDPGNRAGLAYWLAWRQRERQKRPDGDAQDDDFRRGAVWR